MGATFLPSISSAISSAVSSSPRCMQALWRSNNRYMFHQVSLFPGVVMRYGTTLGHSSPPPSSWGPSLDGSDGLSSGPPFGSNGNGSGSSPPHSSDGSHSDAGAPKWWKFLSNLLTLALVFQALNWLTSVTSIIRGHIPKVIPPRFVIPREAEVKRLLALMPGRDAQPGAFCVVTGLPGSGKSSLVIEALRRRGSAVYVDATLAETFDDVIKQINSELPNLYPTIKNILSKAPSRGFETVTALAFIVRRITNKPLVIVVDHIHKLEEAGALRLASIAKAAADKRQLIVFLVGSEDSRHLRSGSDFISRGMEVSLGPPSPTEIRQLIREVLKEKHLSETHKDYFVEELLYLAGPYPANVWLGLAFLEANGGLLSYKKSFDESLMRLRPGDLRSGLKSLEFWHQLLLSGTKGMPRGSPLLPENAQNDSCLNITGSQVFFRNGLCRDWYAKICIKEQEAKGMKEGKEKLQMCMKERHYEAYGPSEPNQP